MATITRVGEIDFGFEARDVAFWDDDTFVLTTPSAEVRSAPVRPGARDGARMFQADEVLREVAWMLGTQGRVEPATGDYPRLAGSARAQAAVVATHDMVLVACSLRPARRLHPLCGFWGIYDPRLSFSRDGSRFFAQSDYMLVFDTDEWKAREESEARAACAWHPHEPWLLRLDRKGRVEWTDWRDAERPVRRHVGALEPVEDHTALAGVAVDGDGLGFVAAYDAPHRLEWWRLDPLRLVATRPSPDGEIYGIEGSPAGGVFATLCEEGLRLWDWAAREPLTGPIEADSVKFSPSGRWLVTMSRESDNPYPRHPVAPDTRSTLWEISS